MANVPVTSWNEANPANTQNVSLGATRITELKGQLREVIEVDHVMSSSGQGATWGLHNKVTLYVQSSDSTAVADSLILYSKDVAAKAELHFIDEDSNLLQLTSKGDFVGGMQYEVRLWSGFTSAIPTGWVLCDGSNFTPDLTDKFIRGIDTISARTFTPAGADTVTLTTTEMPEHDHGTNTSGQSVTHTHTSKYGSGGQFGQVDSSSTTANVTGTLNPSDNASVDHSHVISSEGSGTAFAILPGYVGLAYIMKS